jgi:hypothetical protein
MCTVLLPPGVNPIAVNMCIDIIYCKYLGLICTFFLDFVGIIYIVCAGFNFINSFIPLACAECVDSLPFSGASSVRLCYVLFPATFLHQLFVHSLSPHLAIRFMQDLLHVFGSVYRNIF